MDCKKIKAKFVSEEDLKLALSRVPRKLGQAEEIQQEVIGTILHDLMQFSPPATDLAAILDYLVSVGAKVDALDEDNKTPLHYLITYRTEDQNTVQLLARLLHHMRAIPGLDINLPDSDGLSAPMMSLSKTQWQFLEVLIEDPGCDLLAFVPRLEDNPLAHVCNSFIHVATSANKLSIVKTLVQKGVDPNFPSQNLATPPILLAAQLSDTTLLEYYLTLPAINPNGKNKLEDPPPPF